MRVTFLMLLLLTSAAIAQTPAPVDQSGIWGLLWTGAVTYLPWIISTASVLAAAIPPSAINASPVLKIITAIIDVLAVNIAHAKEGPPPLSVMQEVATGKIAPERKELKG